ncbi:MAG: tRNA 2-thiouridine(34) synthase MnmA [Patescibacteria group bacterium]|jgi:tRNA-specific 2-thiouridylase
MNKNKVAIAMSGGVDSSMAAKTLKDQGHDCLGIFMRLGIERGCCDEDAARKVCQKIGIKFYPIDVRAKFKKEVKDYFLSSYKKGITPNPCVKCNQLIKFGELLKRTKALGCEYLATGHYLKITRLRQGYGGRGKIKNIYKLFRAKDSSKDQTYFLYNLTQEQLKHILFPIGDLIKEKMKVDAKKNKLPHLKTESQDVCFLSGEHNKYLKNNLKLKKGLIKTLDNKVVGEHQGLPLYTIGQRKGVEIGGIGPFYVVKKDFKTNTLFVTNNSNDQALSGLELVAENINWISGRTPKMPFKCQAVIRYRHKQIPCIINKITPSKKRGGLQRRTGCMVNTDKFLVKFSTPQRAITPGQSVVFYKKDELLGGGTVKPSMV